ncbi:DinB family protein [Aliamphritea ceti]|uniref:DinB family protein n=1 Tax=Aliamphritea ceti TaxID=1524258 RepID=UPI0021C26567|nr:DinB family protein [Aliamphritea ceti]
MLTDNYRLMAEYNHWMNSKLLDAASQLSSAELKRDSGAFFNSIMGTFNHLMVGDIIWLQRFAEHPASDVLNSVRDIQRPATLSQMLHDDLSQLSPQRRQLDKMICEFCSQLNDADLMLELEYKNTKGIAFKRRFAYLLQHFFNHQTHHRGQLTTLFSQRGVDVGETDLLGVMP